MEEIRIRDVEEADLAVFFQHQADAEASRMAALPPRGSKEFTDHWNKILADRDVIAQTILCGDQVVGNLVSFLQSGRRLVGYWIGREHWGRGIATRGLQQFLELIRIRPLYAHVAKHNAASLRVLEKCGFEVCGDGPGIPGPDGARIPEFVLKLEAPDRDDG